MNTPAAPAKPYDLVLLGATGYTGRQLVLALRRQGVGTGLRIALAGRRPEALNDLAQGWDVLPADVTDPGSLHLLARRSRVLLNLAGPYWQHGETAIRACIAERCDHLDLSGEVFWMRQMLHRFDAAARKAGVRIVHSCGYEALPFDLAMQTAAARLHARSGERLRQFEIGVAFTGAALTRLSDAISGGTLASMRAVLQHDRSNSLQRMDCLLPDTLPEGWNANAIALASAAPLAPWWDAGWHSVMAPALPAPFINPPLLLRSAALCPEHFAANPRYREGLLMAEGVQAALAPLARRLPEFGWAQAGLGSASRAAQWSAAAALAAPLAALSAAAGSDARLAREALERMMRVLGPRSGEGPREALLDRMGYLLKWRAQGERGARHSGRVIAQGHPGYRSTPEMMAAVGLALAQGALGQGQAGVLSPGAAFGTEVWPRLEAAGLQWQEDDDDETA